MQVSFTHGSTIVVTCKIRYQRLDKKYKALFSPLTAVAGTMFPIQYCCHLCYNQ